MLKPSLQLRLGQQLTMTPQLQQAIRLLQLPIVELQTQIQEALEGNVMLEQLEDTPSVASPDAGTNGSAAEAPAAGEDTWLEDAYARGDDRANASNPDPSPDNAVAEESVVVNQTPDAQDSWSDAAFTGSKDSSAWSGDDRQQDVADLSGDTLQEHLLWQLRLENLSLAEAAIGQALVDAVNGDGYLSESLDTIRMAVSRDLPVTIEQVESMLERVQRLDPAGVAARNLSECLRLQLDQLNPASPGWEFALQIAEHHLELLAGQQYSTLRRRLRASEEELEHAIALVRSLHPRPGSAIQPADPQYVVPDVYVRKLGDRWLVEVNPGAAPRVQVNQTYADALGRGSEHTVLRAHLQEARWLVRSLEIRNDTLLKVATCIVERQHAFLEHGDVAMRPMVLRDVAEVLSMHESTISRVTTNKFMHTPRGIFEFRHFFSSQVGKEGAEHSGTAIRAMIRKLISNENQGKPLSDNKIAQLLVGDGVNVARRTVAKYREAMMIPSSSERRRLAPR